MNKTHRSQLIKKANKNKKKTKNIRPLKVYLTFTVSLSSNYTNILIFIIFNCKLYGN